MFRHQGEPVSSEKDKQKPVTEKEKTHEEKTEEKSRPPVMVKEKEIASTPKKEFNLQTLGELLEKNLKWSQIIYEQNRRINRKLIWMSVMSWIKVAMVLLVVGASLWFLPPLIGNVLGQYQALLGGELNAGMTASRNANNQALEKMFQLLPLTGAQQEQLKTILK